MQEIYNGFGLSIHVQFDSIGFCAIMFQGDDFYIENTPVVYWAFEIDYE
jgi:hypothetical protein